MTARHRLPLPAIAALLLATPLAQAHHLSEAQDLETAAKVFTGLADCEFQQQVDVQAVEGQPGHYRLRFRKAVYELMMERTATGVLRLEDARSGVVWLQIPAKSMLMNTKLGQRVVDACQHAAQKLPQAPAADLGIPGATAAGPPSDTAAATLPLDGSAPAPLQAPPAALPASAPQR